MTTIVIYGEGGVRPEDLSILVKGEEVRVLFVPDKDQGVSVMPTSDYGLPADHDEEVNAMVEQRPINLPNYPPRGSVPWSQPDEVDVEEQKKRWAKQKDPPQPTDPPVPWS